MDSSNTSESDFHEVNLNQSDDGTAAENNGGGDFDDFLQNDTSAPSLGDHPTSAIEIDNNEVELQIQIPSREENSRSPIYNRGLPSNGDGTGPPPDDPSDDPSDSSDFDSSAGSDVSHSNAGESDSSESSDFEWEFDNREDDIWPTEDCLDVCKPRYTNLKDMHEQLIVKHQRLTIKHGKLKHKNQELENSKYRLKVTLRHATRRIQHHEKLRKLHRKNITELRRRVKELEQKRGRKTDAVILSCPFTKVVCANLA